ncbi:MAG: GYF domain-containing protein [Myxococcota bacterium]
METHVQPGPSNEVDVDRELEGAFEGLFRAAEAPRAVAAPEPSGKPAEWVAPPPTPPPAPPKQPLAWFVEAGMEREGPLTLQEVEQRWMDADISSDTLVWHEGMGDWQHVRLAPELAYLVRLVPQRKGRGQGARLSPSPAGAGAATSLATPKGSDVSKEMWFPRGQTGVYVATDPAPAPVGDALSASIPLRKLMAESAPRRVWPWAMGTGVGGAVLAAALVLVPDLLAAAASPTTPPAPAVVTAPVAVAPVGVAPVPAPGVPPPAAAPTENAPAQTVAQAEVGPPPPPVTTTEPAPKEEPEAHAAVEPKEERVRARTGRRGRVQQREAASRPVRRARGSHAECDPILYPDGCETRRVTTESSTRQTLSKADVLRVVKANRGEVARCAAQHGIPAGAPAAGVMWLSWTIRPDGSTTGVRVESPEINGTGLGKCVARAVDAWKFDSYDGPPLKPIRFPFKLDQL